MSATHRIVLKLTFTMDEMDGTPEQSAEIAMNLVSEAVERDWFTPDDVEAIEYGEVEA